MCGGRAMTPFCPSGPTFLLLTKIKQIVQTSVENFNTIFQGPSIPIIIESHLNRLHRGMIYQLSIRWIHYSGFSEPTGRKTGKTLLCGIGLPSVRSGFNSSNKTKRECSCNYQPKMEFNITYIPRYK